MKTITASAASKEFGRFLDTAQREPVIVTKQNRPVAVTLSIQDWEALLASRLESGLAKGLADLDANRVTEISPSSTEARLARFAARMPEAK